MARAAAAADVIVVGGGVVGAAAAAELAAAGASVMLVDRATIAAGASGRNSGVVWHPSDPVLERLYDETLGILRSLAENAPVTAPFELPANPVGILALTWDEGAARADAAALARSNPRFGASFADPAALAALEPSLAPGLAAVRLDIGYPVAPWAATRAFAALATGRGARLLEGTPIRLDRQGDRVVGVVTDDGRSLTAGSVIVAAGPWTPAVIDPAGAWRPIRAYWGVVVELALAVPPRHVLEGPGIDAAIDPAAADAGGGGAGDDVHFSLATADGRSSLGSTFLPDEPDAAVYEPRLRALGATYLPAIADTPTLSRRTCARPLALDGRPLVGRVPGVDGLFVAAGHGPWGLSTGAASGRHVARLALGDSAAVPATIRSALDPARFGPVVA